MAVSKEMLIPKKIKTSGRAKDSDADTGILNMKAMIPARTRPTPATASPNPINFCNIGNLIPWNLGNMVVVNQDGTTRLYHP